ALANMLPMEDAYPGRPRFFSPNPSTRPIQPIGEATCNPVMMLLAMLPSVGSANPLPPKRPANRSPNDPCCCPPNCSRTLPKLVSPKCCAVVGTSVPKSAGMFCPNGCGGGVAGATGLGGMTAGLPGAVCGEVAGSPNPPR